MQAFVPVLLDARAHLQRFQAQRACCLSICAGLPYNDKLRGALLRLLASDPISAFRLHADNFAVLVEDVCDDRAFMHVKGVNSAVDMFYGRSIMQSDTNARANPSSTANTHITGLHRAARRFAKTVRMLPHEGAAKARLDECERKFDGLWRAVAAELHALDARQ